MLILFVYNVRLLKKKNASFDYAFDAPHRTHTTPNVSLSFSLSKTH